MPNSQNKKYPTRGHPKDRQPKYTRKRGKVVLRREPTRNPLFRIVGGLIFSIIRLFRWRKN